MPPEMMNPQMNPNKLNPNAMNAEEKSMEAASPEAETSDTTAFETTSPDTTAPEPTSPEPTTPGSMAPEKLPPGSMAPEKLPPESMSPETTAPESMSPETTAPETMPPEVKARLLKDYPKDCTFTAEDWLVLAQYWYPVALSGDVQEQPLGVKLLDVKLVCYRGSGGRVVVARDLCFHRGAPLSKGWVENGEIVCPYHGFRYDCEGKCTAVPAHPGAKISPKLKLITYPAVERYGLIWTCLAAPSGEEPQIPDFPGWDNPDYLQVLPPAFDIAGSAGRQMEGFLDVSHFAYVHTETFGDPENAEVPQYGVTREGSGLHVEYWSTVSNYGKSQNIKEPEGFQWLREFRVFPPFAASLTVYFPEEGRLNILNCASPVSAKYTRLFSPICRNFDKDVPVQEIIDFNLKVFAEDREMVEAQTPEELPLDLLAEAHIPADRTSIAYRRLLTEMGLGRSYTS